VRDPLGGINSLWPLFGIANQLLAAIALCLATTIILKMQLAAKSTGKGKPALALLTLLPLIWLLIVCMTAGTQKIASPDTRIGFLSLAADLKAKSPALNEALLAAKTLGSAEAVQTAEKALKRNEVLIFNQYLDAAVAALFLILVTIIALMSFWQWYRLLKNQVSPEIKETPPVWLPDYAIVEGKPMKLAGVAALSLALMKELSGEADMERAEQAQIQTECREEHRLMCGSRTSRQKKFLSHLDARYKSIRRCC